MTGRGLDALAGQIDDLRRELTGLRHTVDGDIDALAEVRELVSSMAEQVASLVDGPDSRPRLPSWTEMDADRASEAWTRLVRWMQTVLFVRYPPSTDVVKHCWYRHPEVVEQLSWLQVTWALAYHNPQASVGMAAEWHNRWLPAVLDRTRAILRPCYIEHVDDSRVPPERHHGFDESLNAFIRADLARRPQA